MFPLGDRELADSVQNLVGAQRGLFLVPVVEACPLVREIDRAVAKLTGKASKDHADAHEQLLAIAKKAAERTMKKKSVVTVAPEVDPEEAGRPPVPAGRKSLRVVN